MGLDSESKCMVNGDASDLSCSGVISSARSPPHFERSHAGCQGVFEVRSAGPWCFSRDFTRSSVASYTTSALAAGGAIGPNNYRESFRLCSVCPCLFVS